MRISAQRSAAEHPRRDPRAAYSRRDALARLHERARCGRRRLGLNAGRRNRPRAGAAHFPSGKALSQTGGHGDFRPRGDLLEPCSCCFRAGAIARVVDGVDAVRLAVREEIQKGATQIKIMASGGVASPTDPIANTQYSEDEIRAIVQEAEAANTYVMAHAYTGRSIARAVRCGVRTIEHGNLVDEAAAQVMKEEGAFVVPTLVTYDALAKHGAQYGMPPDSIAKVASVQQAGRESLEIYARAGVAMGFGSDLLGEMHAFQCGEFRSAPMFSAISKRCAARRQSRRISSICAASWDYRSGCDCRCARRRRQSAGRYQCRCGTRRTHRVCVAAG